MGEPDDKNPSDSLTKRQVKAAYLRSEFGLSDAISALMFDHSMDRGAALHYLGL